MYSTEPQNWSFDLKDIRPDNICDFRLAPRKFQCDCGKTIEYIDRVVGGNNAQSAILVCAKCQKEHRIVFLGFLSEIKGAALKS